MNSTITKITIGLVTLVSGGAYIPIIPTDLESGLSLYPAMRGYQYEAGSDRTYYKQVASTTAEGVEITVLENRGPLADADFEDEDSNGVISVAVFTDNQGNDVYKKITDEEYRLMGIVGGAQNNPKETEMVSLFEAYTPVVDAAIAVDTTASGWVASASSLTYAHTVTGSDPTLIVGIYHFNGSGEVTGVTYNGAAMTLLGNLVADGTNGDVYLYGKASVSTGANNIVISEGATQQIFGTSASYTGTNQTTPFPDAALTGSPSGTTFSISTTNTTVDQSWVVMTGRSPSRVPSASAGSFLRKTNAVSGDAAWLVDSNGARSTGANTLNYTYSPSQTTYYVIANIAPTSGAAPEATVSPVIRIDGDISFEGDMTVGI